LLAGLFLVLPLGALGVDEFPKPYSAPCVERENVFEFTEKPAVRSAGLDRHEITFAVKGACDVTVSLVDEAGTVVRHVGSGVLGANAPAPFQKNSLKQALVWDGKDDLGGYVRDPGKLKVRVSLGLKPEFDKRLGCTNPKLIPGAPWAICIDETGAYVFYSCPFGGQCAQDVRLRKFDRDGNYVRTLIPASPDLPEEKLAGLGYVEYEPGRKALQSADLKSVFDGNPLAGGLPQASLLPPTCRPALANGRLYYYAMPLPMKNTPFIHYIRSDGTFEAAGSAGQPMAAWGGTGWPRLAASPDGKWLYAAGDKPFFGSSGGTHHAVFRCSTEDPSKAGVFVGQRGKPGSDAEHFNTVQGIDCDSQGRVYVCDSANGRVQVFSPEAKFLKSIALDRPEQVLVHRGTGAVYVRHLARVQGASVTRISKLTSFDDPKVEHVLDGEIGLPALDSWSTRPRLWLYGVLAGPQGHESLNTNVRIFEDDGRQFRKIADFRDEVKAEQAQSGVRQPEEWAGRVYNNRITCDPVRDKVYDANTTIFDLRTGKWEGTAQMPGTLDDMAFDKRGYLHWHLRPSTSQGGVVRVDVSRGTKVQGRYGEAMVYPEVPYDYGTAGETLGAFKGILPCFDQLGAKSFQDGIGVNMRGDVAEQCNIYYAPKTGDGDAYAMQGRAATLDSGLYTEEWNGTDDRWVKEMEKKGAAIAWIKPGPGLPNRGATIWTFDRNGVYRDKFAVIAGGLINGVALDEDGDLYFVNNRTRLVNGKAFLAGNGGLYGSDAKKMDPFTGTLIKTGPRATVLSTSAPIKLDEAPARPPEFTQYREESWCEGAKWLYAGASGIVPGGCSCPTMRCHTDWFKRTFVPEKYRHSIGVLDTAGNLILHVGQYGNFDSGYGPQSKVQVGGDGIAMSDCRIVSGTDNYLCFNDRGERIIVLRLNYHAEETVGVAK
jgi:hypothetical protein